MLKAFSPTKTLLLFYNVIVVSVNPLLALPQWQRVKMLAEDLSEERKFCHLTSVYCPTLSQADPSPFSHLRTSGPFSHLRTARLQELSDTLCTRRWLSQWGVSLSALSHLQVSSTEGTGFPGKLINSGIHTDDNFFRCDSIS